MVLYCYLQVKTDIAELNKFLAAAERQKVKDVLLIEIRKLEPELSALKDLTVKNGGDSVNSARPANPKCYEVKLTNYGKYLSILCVILIFCTW